MGVVKINVGGEDRRGWRKHMGLKGADGVERVDGDRENRWG